MLSGMIGVVQIAIAIHSKEIGSRYLQKAPADYNQFIDIRNDKL